MEKKELDSMKRLRGLIWGLGFAAIVGLSAREAQAGPLTITLTWGGGAHTLSFDYTTAYAQTGSTANSLTVNTQALNAALTGSAFTFTDLGASSNNPGSGGAAGATISETGTVLQSTTGTTDMTISVNQTGFTIPSGPGMLSSSSGGTYTTATTGDTTRVFSTLDGTNTSPTDVYTYSGTSSTQSYSNSTHPTMVMVTGSSSGYPLGDSVAITMGAKLNAKDQFTVSAVFAAVPEPASLVMMVTGMPLPLVVMGLLRRRRAAA
jgi:hypothetical protein